MGMDCVVSKVMENIWQFNEANAMGPYVDAYLIVGSEKALLVDSLQTAENLYEEVRKITDLPVEVIITHGHFDHAGASLKFFKEAGCPIYMDLVDMDILNGMSEGFPEEFFLPVTPGMKFDLGNRVLEVIPLPGHTQGCLVVLDEENQLLFSGDSIGSGHFWMQVPKALPLARFQMVLQRFYDRVKELKDLLIYPGHRNQSPVQLTLQYIKDTLTLTKRIVSGVIEGEDAVLDMGPMHMEYKHVGYGMMVDMCYNPKTIRSAEPNPKEEAIKDQFVDGEITKGGKRLLYKMFKPETKPGETYPLVVFLHGGGECGDGDNLRLVLANSGPINFAAPEWQAEHPCYVFAPQCPLGMNWTSEENVELLVKAIMTFPAQYPIDRNRVYVTGLSLGGIGTWNIIAKYPNLFAAAMPICGVGDPFEIKNAKNLPIWAFHAEDDPTVPVTGYVTRFAFTNKVGSRMMVSSLRAAGNRQVRYTEYPAGELAKMGLFAHAAWVPAYDSQEVKEWLFAQNRFDRYDVELIQPGVWYIEDFNNDSIYVVEGTEKALVIDTGLGGGDLIGLVKTLTHLPFELAITHAHGDHMLHSDKFGKFYMSAKDIDTMYNAKGRLMPDNKSEAEDVMDIKAGDKIDLGGGVVIEVFDVGGHTPGSVAFLDEYHGVCFTGDAFGVWMQVPGAIAISEYRENLKKFLADFKARGLEHIAFCGGHRRQEGGAFPYNLYSPNSLERVADMIELCDKILNDEVDFAPFTMRTFGEPAYTAKWGTATMVFKESVRK